VASTHQQHPASPPDSRIYLLPLAERKIAPKQKSLRDLKTGLEMKIKPHSRCHEVGHAEGATLVPQ
jgi:hypothetical protein